MLRRMELSKDKVVNHDAAYRISALIEENERKLRLMKQYVSTQHGILVDVDIVVNLLSGIKENDRSMTDELIKFF